MKPQRCSEHESCERSNCYSDIPPKCPKRTSIQKEESSITSVDYSYEPVILQEYSIDYTQSIKLVETKSRHVDCLIGMVIYISVPSQTTLKLNR